MNKLKILVFPCGSEVGLEIYRSLKYARHFEIWGGSSINDHGRYLFENYIGGLPFADDKNFILEIKKIIIEYSIDAIYPAMDKVIKILKENEDQINCKIIGSPIETVRICNEKKLTYYILSGIVNTPKQYCINDDNLKYPIFMKPNIGYGSRGAKIIKSSDDLNSHLCEYPDSLLQEFLPGDEYTVDCFTDRNGELLFVGPRKRQRIRMGISVNTKTIEGNDKEEFLTEVSKINNAIEFRGAWFCQFKRNKKNRLILMEVACRIGGSTGVFRAKGINLALLSVWDSFNYDVSVIDNGLCVEMDRAFDCRFNINYNYDTVYVDLDDCLIFKNNTVNYELISMLFKFINEGKKVILLTKHEGCIETTLKKFRLISFFDKIIQISKSDLKSDYIESKNSFFIDDSFVERNEVFHNKRIPVFSPADIIGQK